MLCGLLLVSIIRLNRPTYHRFDWLRGVIGLVIMHLIYLQSINVAVQRKDSGHILYTALLSIGIVVGDVSFVYLAVGGKQKMLKGELRSPWYVLEPFATKLRRLQHKSVIRLLGGHTKNRWAQNPYNPLAPSGWILRLKQYADLKWGEGGDWGFTYPVSVLVAASTTVPLLVWLEYSVNSFVIKTSSDMHWGQEQLVIGQRRAQNTKVMIQELTGLCSRIQAGSVPVSNRTQFSMMCGDALDESVRFMDDLDGAFNRAAYHIGNLPSAITIAFTISSYIALILSVFMIAVNMAGVKRWVLRIWRGHIVPGCNVTTGRKDHDVARSGEYVAVFISTHLVSFFVVTVFLGFILTGLIYSHVRQYLVEHRQAIIAYVLLYLIVYFFLRSYIGNYRLSEQGQEAKHPRVLTNFLICLAVYYVLSAVAAAIIRVLLYLPLFFVQFARLDDSPFPAYWQALDYPYRACQSMLCHHTRSTNAVATVFCEQLFTARRDARARALAGNYRDDCVEEARHLRVRNRWHLSKLLLSNPCLRAHRRVHMAPDTHGAFNVATEGLVKNSMTVV